LTAQAGFWANLQFNRDRLAPKVCGALSAWIGVMLRARPIELDGIWKPPVLSFKA
jgi:hypothetical protein